VNVAALKTAGRDVGVVLATAVAGWFLAGATGFWCAAAVAATVFHLSSLFGVSYRAAWRDLVNRRRLTPRAGAEVVDFARPARARRARRILADLSAAATSAALSRRRRAARS
jgi:hypothetical protein